MDNSTANLYKSSKTILTNKDLSLIWKEVNKNNLNAKIAYYTKKKAIKRLTRGVFTKNENYNPKELAVKIYNPSYISFETVLLEAGVIFQYYETIFLASKRTKTITVDKKTFTFRKLKDEILFNTKEIVKKENYSIASPERAFLDMIYLFPNYYFDNLRPLNWEKCFDLIKLYNNKQMIKRLNNYYKNYVK